MIAAEIDTLAAGLAPVIKDLMTPLFTRIADLERRLNEVKDGRDGKDGVDGKSIDPDAIELMVSETVARYAALIPKGQPGEKGATGEKGDPGLPGRDGDSVMDALIDRDGNLNLILGDGTTKTLGVVVGQPGPAGAHGANGKDGTNGTNGLDGLGFEDLDVLFNEDTGYILRFARGELVKEFPLAIPWDTGAVWESGKVYPKGAGLRMDGSWWIAQTQTSAQPGHNKAWRLAVKKGTDGRQGPIGPEGTRGPKGEQGLPGPARY